MVGGGPVFTLPLVWLPLGLGRWECVASLLLIGQLTLLYPLFLPFWGDAEAAVCGYIKLPVILPGSGEANEVLANNGSGGDGVCVRH